MISASDYKMQPTDNDVLSGRGAWYNNHPGNKRFRKMLDDQKQAYMTGTKKQKMDISKAIVEAIHSMDPPGRFLKKCPPYGQWMELSKRDAADKAAQAMAWIINGWKKTTLKGEHSQQSRRRRRRRSLPLPVAKDDRNEDYVDDVQSSQPDDPPTQQNLKRSSSQSESSQPLSVAAQEDDGVVATHYSAGAEAAVVNNNDDAKSASVEENDEIDDEMCRSVPVPRIINIQQHLPSQTLQSNNNNPASSSSNAIDPNVSQNEILQMLVQILRPQQQQQRRHQQHDQLFHHSTLDHNNITLGLIHQLAQHSSAVSLEALAQFLVQIQHQLIQQQQLIEQQQLLIQLLVLTNHHLNVPSSPLLPTPLSSATPFQLDNHGVNINMQQPQQHQSEPSNDALMIGAISAVQQSMPNHTQPFSFSSSQSQVQQQHQYQQQQQSLWIATQLGAYVNQMLQHSPPQLNENTQLSMASRSYTASAGQDDAIDEEQDKSKQNRTPHR